MSDYTCTQCANDADPGSPLCETCEAVEAAEATITRLREESEAARQCHALYVEGAQEEIRRLTRERDEAREVLRDLSCDGCEYGDDCQPNGGTRHGECTACKCRRALGGG